MKAAPSLLLCTLALAQTPEYLPFTEVQPALTAKFTAETWDQWVRKRDTEIRRRIDEGEELTLSNLLRLGVTFTRRPRIEYSDLDLYPTSAAIKLRASTRADDLVRALSSPTAGAGLEEMREFVTAQGHTLDGADGRRKCKDYLLALLVKQRTGVAENRQRAKSDPSVAFRDRGLSTDSDLFPDYLLDRHLRAMLEKGLLKPGSVHRIAIVGPGLDFVNKKFGADFYPPQSTQPFAVIDSLLRLRLASLDTLDVYALDISPRVIRHLERARRDAEAGKPYVIQLMNTASDGWNADYVATFRRYWQNLGSQVGKPATALTVPASLSEGMSNRAVAVRPEVVARITPVEMNAIFQRLPLLEDHRFDLIIGTNIFLYYDAAEQSIARVTLGSMLKPGRFVLSNTGLAGEGGSRLVKSLDTQVLVTDVPLMFEPLFSYVLRR